MQGIIVKIIGGLYYVAVKDRLHKCRPLGLFRYKNIDLRVGDYVDIENEVIVTRCERKNELDRPKVANIDKVFIVNSVIDPRLNLNLLDRIISAAEARSIPIVIVFTKLDLACDDEILKCIAYYRMLYPVYLLPGEGDKLSKELDGAVVAVAGMSGVGKSTLANLFSALKVEVGEVSASLKRGKHTTRCVSLIPCGTGYIADSPGFSRLEMQTDETRLKDTFKEFRNLNCKYQGCLHLAEPGCMVKEKIAKGEIATSRYQNYLLLLGETRKRKKGL